MRLPGRDGDWLFDVNCIVVGGCADVYDKRFYGVVVIVLFVDLGNYITRKSTPLISEQWWLVYFCACSSVFLAEDRELSTSGGYMLLVLDGR
jgi:hypothetical protein